MRVSTAILAACAAVALLAAPVGAQGQNLPQQGPPAQDIPIVLLVDMSSGQTLFAREENRRFVPASITKVMTAFTAFELMEEGVLTPDQVFTFNEAAAEEWYRTGSTMFLEAGQEVSVSDLLMAITTVSANDGSIVLAEGALGSVPEWVARMNANARSLNLQNSFFGTPNGWPDAGRTFTTARDLVTLGQALVLRHPDRFARYFGHRGLRTNGYAQDNHDPISGIVEGADGIKTGFTNQAGFGFLGTAKRGDRRLMMVLAGAGEEPERDAAARALVEWGFSAFDSTQLFAGGARVGSVRVQDGSSSTVPVLASAPILFAVPKGEQASLSLAITYDGPLQAPIAAGETVARLEISVEGMASSSVPLVAAQDVPQAGFLDRIGNAFGRLLP
ncbi:D-alanyl-D-alanine carboxypeptidase family protein [Parerythrobacter jejuensis]|uniref:D-alanyl-D-alanine carboxypeptidase family protein n=1 Tax=Parerythrobacter jejuensis TaxID=795812 RepID=UPI002D7F9AD7|nr:D-alanyl-D-alanine carboxypeptidase family protein [Parerythrobacter jejuensis]